MIHHARTIISHARRRAARGTSAVAVAMFFLGYVITSMGTTSRLKAPMRQVVPAMQDQEWIQGMLASGGEGECHLSSGIYAWRNYGWGTNINFMLYGWHKGISLGKNDFALDVSQGYMNNIDCSSTASKMLWGWDCIFKPMKRLCVFNRQEDAEDQGFESFRGPPVRRRGQQLEASGGTETMEADAVTAAVLLKFLHSNMQPWFEDAIRAILREDQVVSIRSEQFVALHVRRGDKLIKEAGKIEVQVYLQAAALYLWQSSGDRSGVHSISGVWVSSDDSQVLAEVRKLAPLYFPNVATQNVTTISFRHPGQQHGRRNDELPTTAATMTYELYVSLQAELCMMSEADVFVGTFSSNVARLVYLMRESNGFPRNSTLSVDEFDWWLG